MIENNQSLFELFGSKVFRIPDYQRGYAWGEKQLSALWEDLEDIPEDNGEYKKHYTGTIFLKETAKIERWCKDTFYDVIDGQQLLTTISILLYELLKSSPNGLSSTSREDLFKRYIAISNSTNDCKVYRLSYSRGPKNQNYEFLLSKIFEDEKIILPSECQNSYTKNLENAKNFFRVKISTLSHEEKEVLYNKLTTSLIFDLRISEVKDEQT